MSQTTSEQNIGGYSLEELEMVKKKVKDKSYFKDSVDWYFFRYLTPVCDRTLLIVSSIISIVVIYFLVQMIKNTYPLVEEFPIFYKSKDQSIYVPKLVQLKRSEFGVQQYSENKQDINVDEAVLKYLLVNYIKERESFNFKSAEISEVNKKFNIIKNLSSPSEYKKFQSVMNRENPGSPLRFFGKNVEREVKIESFNFVRKVPKNFAEKAKEFIFASIPTQADVRFSINTIKTNVNTGETKQKQELFLVKLDFFFRGVIKDSNSDLDFTVTNYQLFR